MSAFQRALLHATKLALIPGARVTATGNGTGVDMQDFDGTALVVADFGAGGSGATLDIKLQESADNSTGWTDIAGAAFAQMGNAANQPTPLAIDVAPRLRYWRAVKTIGGTATFDGSCVVLGMKKYQP